MLPAKNTVPRQGTVGQKRTLGLQSAAKQPKTALMSAADRNRPTLGGGQFWSDRRWNHGFRLQQKAGTEEHRLLNPNDRCLLTGTFEDCLSRLPTTPTQEELVVLLHGLGRRSASLRPLARHLESLGLDTVLIDYASTRRSIDAHARGVQELIAHLEGTREVSVVTHSLGGLVVRRALGEGWPENVTPKRLVMLAPPSLGADLAKRLSSAPFRAVLGPSGNQLTSAVDLPIPTIPFCIIAGSMRDGKGLNPLLEGDDDGIVRVDETYLEGATEHHIVSSLHTTIMNHPDARRLIERFLLD